MWCQFARPAHVHTRCPSSHFALAGAGPDQLFFELSEPAEDGEHQPAMSRCRVRPYISQRLEAGATLGDLIQGVEQVTRRSSQPVKPRYHKHVAIAKPVHDLTQLGAVCLCTACLLAVNLGTASRMERGVLCGQGLPVSR